MVKERLDLSPQLRELDVRIEKVELALRRSIDAELEGDPGQLPSHVLEKINGRVQAAAKKNAALDRDHYDSLGGMLEYADLWELKDTIMNKSLWYRFEASYVNKETLGKRFDQLADLRNGIRHSRSVDEITRKEGEVGIMWFEQVNGR